MKRGAAGVLLLAAASSALAGQACHAQRSDFIPMIPVDPRAAGRLDLIAHSAEARTPPVPPARVHAMKDGEQLGGPTAVGRPGDMLVENEEVAFVIDQIGPGAGFAESGGNIVDAADAHARRDELGQVFTFFGTFPRQAVYDAMTSGTERDGTAWVESRGTELFDRNLAVVTRYTLHPPDRALVIKTAVQNRGTAPVELAGLGDAIQWGGVEKLAPGRPVGFKGPTTGPYVGGVGRYASYAIASTDGDIEAKSGRGWTDTLQRKGVKLAPGESVSYERVLLVGERPDTASLVGELTMAAGQPVGDVEASLPEGGVPPTGYRIALLPEGSVEALTLAPPFTARLPVGRYHVASAAGSAGPVFQVSADKVARFDAPVPPAGSLEVQCTDAAGAAMPCKVTFEGLDSTPTPAFGFPHGAGPAGSQATTSTGAVQVVLAAGKYRVTASRGPEYALATVEVMLGAGERSVRPLKLVRVVDTRGYVAADFHQHTALGMDAPVTTRDRMIANVAEGVEVTVASEHNLVVDLGPVVRELGMQREIVSIPGDELTSDANVAPWGHANAYPLAPDATKVRGGATQVTNRTAHEAFEDLRRGAGEFVLQINHPRSGVSGYFDLMHFDPATGTATGAGYDARFDALEVWNGRNLDARDRVLVDFLALLRTGQPVTPTADTDTHGIVGQEAGYPRTYVRVADDAHLEAWDAARTADFVRGVKSLRDVVLTNGPMLRVTANGVGVGGVVRSKAVRVSVEVESAPWVVVEEVKLVWASGAERGRAAKVAQKVSGSGSLVGSVSFDVKVGSDDAFVVIASGSKSLAPVVPGDGDEKALPWAMTGAIWVDANGDGKALGR
jgi:hypothetical protein